MKRRAKAKTRLAPRRARVYKKSMARRASAIVALGPDDVRALARARALGIPPSDLIRQGLRLAAAPYYKAGRRAPATRLFVSTDAHLGGESHLFEDLEGDLIRRSSLTQAACSGPSPGGRAAQRLGRPSSKP